MSNDDYLIKSIEAIETCLKQLGEDVHNLRHDIEMIKVEQNKSRKKE